MFVLRNVYIVFLTFACMKKFGVFVFLSLILISGFVSAQSVGQSVEGFLNDFSAAISPIARFILGSDSGFGFFGESNAVLSGDNLAVKLLVFLLVFIFAAAGVRNIPIFQEKPASSFLVAAIISIIGVRFITTEALVDLIWLPTTTFTVALTSIIPFIIFFFLIEGFDSRVLRKFSWSTYLVIFLYFAISRRDELNVVGGTFSAAWIYLIIAALSGALIFFDRDIHAMFRRQGLEKIKDRSKRLQAIEVASSIDDLYSKLARAKDAGDRRAIEQEIKTKEANLKELYG